MADPKARGLVAARLWSVYHEQIGMADAHGRPVRIASGGANQAGDANELNVDYRFLPSGAPGVSPRLTCGSTGPRGSPGSCRSSSETFRSLDRSDPARSRPCRSPWS